MQLSLEPKPDRKGLLYFYIILISIMPLLISLLIHSGFLIYSNYISWTFGDRDAPSIGRPATIVLDGRQNDRLRFQGTDPLDSFDADDNLDYPVPEIEYQPVIPEMEIFPEPKVRDESDIISVEAVATDQQWITPSTGGQPVFKSGRQAVPVAVPP